MAAGICCHPLTWQPSLKNKLSCSTAGDKCPDMQGLGAIGVYRATGRTTIASSCSIQHFSELILVSKQCSQTSGAPVGPGRRTVKSPGRYRTVKRSPSSCLIPLLVLLVISCRLYTYVLGLSCFATYVALHFDILGQDTWLCFICI